MSFIFALQILPFIALLFGVTVWYGYKPQPFFNIEI
jgi:hypothetical protein